MILKSVKETFIPLNLGSASNDMASLVTLLTPLYNLNIWNSMPNYCKWVISISLALSFLIVRFFYMLDKNINSQRKQIEYMASQLQEKDDIINIQKIAWGEALKHLRTAYSYIHWLRKNTSYERTSFMKTMIEFCDELQIMYNKKTNSKCCVSIKVAKKKVDIDETEQLNSLVFENLCRDSKHNSRDNQKYISTEHTVLGNTAYSYIISKMLNHKYDEDNICEIGFIHNDVKNDPRYRTTSKECYDNNEIPYESELVYPIIPYKRSNLNKYVMIGFICIDCKDKEKFFKDEYELPMISGVADGIYDILLSYLLNTNKWK